MFISRVRLFSDIARWQAEGHITPQGAAEIRRDLDSRTIGTGPTGALAVLGAILLGFAIMSFVAANWAAMPKLAKLALLFSGIAASYGTAFELFRRNLDVFAHAAVLAGVALFGGAIMLIAQMYHMDGHPPDAVWLWALGALAAGWLLKSNPALAAATVLICVWSFMEVTGSSRNIHWGFLPMWALAAGGIATTRWVRGMHLLALALSGWIVASCLQADSHTGRMMLTLIGLALAAIAAFAGDTIDRWRRISPTMLVHGMVLAYVGLFLIQFFPGYLYRSGVKPNLWLWGSITLALLIAAMAAGWRTHNSRVLWLAYTGFAIEIFALYIAKIGSLLGTSAFFLVTGILVMALAVLAYRMRTGLAAGQPVGGSESQP
jgi:uncharacterized membrane protein